MYVAMRSQDIISEYVKGLFRIDRAMHPITPKLLPVHVSPLQPTAVYRLSVAASAVRRD